MCTHQLQMAPDRRPKSVRTPLPSLSTKVKEEIKDENQDDEAIMGPSRHTSAVKARVRNSRHV